MSGSFLCPKAGCIPGMLYVVFGLVIRSRHGQKYIYTFRTYKAQLAYAFVIPNVLGESFIVRQDFIFKS